MTLGRWTRALGAIWALGALSCGSVGNIGDACFKDSDCPSTAAFLGLCSLNYPNGYCTRLCAQDSDCGQGSLCVASTTGANCARICTKATDCRVSDGYSCSGTVPDGRKYCTTQ
jgi:hypothetical protein